MSWPMFQAVRVPSVRLCCRCIATFPPTSQSARSPPSSATEPNQLRWTYRDVPVDVSSGSVEDKITALTSYDPIPVKGYDFSNAIDYNKMMESMRTVGFQASHFDAAVDEVKRMLAKKREPLTEEERRAIMEKSWTDRAPSKCTIFLGYASSIITSGLRETMCFLAKNNLVDCIVTTAGGIEEDFMKCYGDFYVGDFRADGADMFKMRVNRAGNIFVPESHYYHFTDFMQPILEDMMDEQNKHGMNWTPSKMIARMGREINDESSVYYWAYKNNIPVFSPAITDGGIGDEILYLHQRNKNNNLRIDIAEDSNRIIELAQSSINTGMITVGAGIGKHHICQANAHRSPEGADYAVYLNTAQEFDGSDSGAMPEEAVSWGKIKGTAKPVKVFGEASIIFPLLVAETFAKMVYP
ncbi:deoxyhypusine synthase [Strongylocentrotus purpuratus]|uniref:deoxyhypusine synthase n=1 Tax=Strongylocentrotus purpuratus TaxID=7668 RepID=A0A7M7NW20_STRPU|nr:deoxyhypusine synthase [Strongylocentrotus purpuratus]